MKVENFFRGEKKYLGEKKLNFFFSKNESCLKLPELLRNQFGGGGGPARQTDNRHRRVICRVAPCKQKKVLRLGHHYLESITQTQTVS